MPKKKKREDEEILFFAFKLVGSLVLALVVAAGIDVSRAIEVVSKIYGRSL